MARNFYSTLKKAIINDSTKLLRIRNTSSCFAKWLFLLKGHAIFKTIQKFSCTKKEFQKMNKFEEICNILNFSTVSLFSTFSLPSHLNFYYSFCAKLAIISIIEEKLMEYLCYSDKTFYSYQLEANLVRKGYLGRFRSENSTPGICIIIRLNPY